MASEKLLPKKVALDRWGIKRTKCDELVAAGLLPKPIKIPTPAGTPGRNSYWPESVVDACVKAMALQRLDDLRRIASQDLNAMFGGAR